MNEDYVSLEVAKLLKEKGFDWDCNNKQYLEMEPVLDSLNPLNSLEFKFYPRPRLFIAQEWLRKTHDIYIVVKPHYSAKYEIVEFEYEVYSYDEMVIGKADPIKSEEYYELFTECLNDAILEALKSI